MGKSGKNDSISSESLNTELRKGMSEKGPIDEAKVKNIIRVQYKESNQLSSVVASVIDSITKKYKEELMQYIQFIDQNLELIVFDENGRKTYEMRSTLTEEELNFLAIKIPASCMYVQDFINNKGLDGKIAEYLFEYQVTENLKRVMGGDAKERLRIATQNAEVEQLVSIIKNQVYYDLKNLIDRADKVYEGVKKNLDGINREKGLFLKSNKY